MDDLVKRFKQRLEDSNPDECGELFRELRDALDEFAEKHRLCMHCGFTYQGYYCYCTAYE